MAKILITSGPTRQYLDPVRFLTNASSGRMGAALAQAALDLGHEVTVVSGPVTISYPDQARILSVITTEDMLHTVETEFAQSDGLIGAAAPCDYMPRHVSQQKLSKTGQPLELELIETPDVVATAGAKKRPNQWVVGFALETEDRRFRAITKMQRKCCDLMVSNGPQAIDSMENQVEILDPQGILIAASIGSKEEVAHEILRWIEIKLISRWSQSER